VQAPHEIVLGRRAHALYVAEQRFETLGQNAIVVRVGL
jgi:hypothetical protein